MSEYLDQFKGLIFDLDGTLIDSMPTHLHTWSETLAKYGLEVELAVFHELAGISTLKTVEIFNERFGWQLVPEVVAKEKENHYRMNFQSVQVIEPVLAIARANLGMRPMAIVTGGLSHIVHDVLKWHGLDILFPVVVCAEDTKGGKDSPEPFLLAAEKIGVDPSKCVLFDDGDAGLHGATAACMGIIRVDPTVPEIFVQIGSCAF